MKGKRSVVKISSINYVKLSRESNIIIWGFWWWWWGEGRWHVVALEMVLLQDCHIENIDEIYYKIKLS